MARMVLVLLVLGVTMLAVSGCATPGAGSPGSPGVEPKGMVTETLRPSGLHEDCMELSVGQTLGFSFESSKPVNFNLHYHEGSEVAYPVNKENTPSYEGSFRPDKKHYYCLMWTNMHHEPVTLRYSYSVTEGRK